MATAGEPRPGDWLAVLDEKKEAVVLILEVVAVRGSLVEGFELFPEEGRPVTAPVSRCLPFARPGYGP